MDIKKQRAFLKERRNLLNNLLEYVELMEESIQSEDSEKLEKMKRDFNYLLEKFEFVEKRS